MMSEFKQLLLRYELAKIGFPDARYIPEIDKVKVQPDNNRMPEINGEGNIRYGTEYENIALHTLRPLVDNVNEAIAAWEKSRAVPFDDLSKFCIMSEYNNVVLAARDDTVYGRGLHFTTWQYNFERTGFDHGHYTEDYIAAKEDFAVRAGLIPATKILTPEQAQEVKAAIEYRISNDGDITMAAEDMLKTITAKLNDAYPVKTSPVDEDTAKENRAAHGKQEKPSILGQIEEKKNEIQGRSDVKPTKKDNLEH